MHRSLPIIVAASIGFAGAVMLGAGSRAQPTTQDQPTTQPQTQPQTQPEAQPETPPAKVSDLIGTYDPRAVFDQSERSTHLTEKLAELQTQMQQAQQQGDQATMMQIQQQAQQLQSTEVQAFLDALKQVLPDIAKEAGVKIVAIDYAYVEDSLGTPKDLTQALSDKIP